MKKRCTAVFPLHLLSAVAIAAAVFLLAPNAEAYETWNSCANCHGSFRSSPYRSQVDGQTWSSSLHDVHRNDMLGGDCDACHTSGGYKPVFLGRSSGSVRASSCLGCHSAPGLQTHHDNSGISTCTNCHGVSSPAGENAMPSYYAALGMDPCNPNGEEDFGGSSLGMDNDGDLLYDQTDPDCAPAPSPGELDSDNDGFTPNQGDCNDADAGINPDATEICGDGIDQDCSGADELCPTDPNNVDNDGDGMTENQGDCNDADPSIFLGANDLCGDGIDQDCSGADLACTVDPNNVDDDGDTFTENQGDCNDNDASVHPGATETCDNGIDENCDPSDDICTPIEDADADGFSVAQGDCNDTNDTIHPGAAELCGNGIDENCDPSDDICPDVDRDGVSAADGDCNDLDAEIHPGATELAGNGVDENCNGMADDQAPAGDACTDPGFKIKRAVYNAAKNKLAIRGKSGMDAAITITDSDRDSVFAAGKLVGSGKWRLVVKHLSDAPDTIRVESDNGCSAETDVRIRKKKAEREDHANENDDAEETPGLHPFGWDDPKDQHEDVVEHSGVADCIACHSIDPADKGRTMSCFRCHGQEWKAEDKEEEDSEHDGEAEPATHAFGWANPAAQHPEQVATIGVDACAVCHNTTPADRGEPLSCFNCHGNEWGDDEVQEEPGAEDPESHPFGWDNPRRQHEDYVERHGPGECRSCHSTAKEDRGEPLSCYNCHGREW